jgi:hypothetical protein
VIGRRRRSAAATARERSDHEHAARGDEDEARGGHGASPIRRDRRARELHAASRTISSESIKRSHERDVFATCIVASSRAPVMSTNRLVFALGNVSSTMRVHSTSRDLRA